MKNELKNKFIEMVTTRIIVQLYDEQDDKPKLLTSDDFKLKLHEGMPYFTLGDIENQIKEKHPNTSMCIDVWYELGLNGYIYRCTEEEGWTEHGTTRGYA